MHDVTLNAETNAHDETKLHVSFGRLNVEWSSRRTIARRVNVSAAVVILVTAPTWLVHVLR